MKTHELKAALCVLRSAGYLVVHWAPDELEGVSQDDVNALEEQLVNFGENFIHEHTDDEAPMCAVCNGSGEGMYDGSRCSSCHGHGVEQREKEYDV